MSVLQITLMYTTLTHVKMSHPRSECGLPPPHPPLSLCAFTRPLGLNECICHRPHLHGSLARPRPPPPRPPPPQSPGAPRQALWASFSIISSASRFSAALDEALALVADAVPSSSSPSAVLGALVTEATFRSSARLAGGLLRDRRREKRPKDGRLLVFGGAVTVVVLVLAGVRGEVGSIASCSTISGDRSASP